MKLNRQAFFKLMGAAVTVFAAPKFAEAKLSKHIVVEPKVLAVDVPRYSDSSTIIRQFVGKNIVVAKSLPGINIFDVADMVCADIDRNDPDFICVHTIGLGHAVKNIIESKGYHVVGCSRLDSNPKKRDLYKTYFSDPVFKNNSVAPG